MDNHRKPSSAIHLGQGTVSPPRRTLLKVAAGGLVATVFGPLLNIGVPAIAAEKRAGKVLIAYYSRTGTTREVANQIHQSVGGDLIEIRTAHSYPAEYRATTDQAKRELEAGFRPKLAVTIPNFETYDTVFLGYPNWWGTMPMAFFTLLEQYDFAGKTIVPFCTHEGSRMGRSVDDIRALSPNATILDSLALRGGGRSRVTTESARQDVAEWLTELRNTA